MPSWMKATYDGKFLYGHVALAKASSGFRHLMVELPEVFHYSTSSAEQAALLVFSADICVFL